MLAANAELVSRAKGGGPIAPPGQGGTCGQAAPVMRQLFAENVGTQVIKRSGRVGNAADHQTAC